MRRGTKIAIAGAGAAAVLVAAGAGVGLASSHDDTDRPITGEEYDQAASAALAHLGGGTVTDTEVGDEESYYEVEVTLEDGSQVDVQLDESFDVVGASADRETPDDTD